MEKEKGQEERKNVWVMPDDFLGPSYFEEEVARDLEASKDKAEIDAFWERHLYAPFLGPPPSALPCDSVPYSKNTWKLPEAYKVPQIALEHLILPEENNWYNFPDPGKDSEIQKLMEKGIIFKNTCGKYFAKQQFSHDIFIRCFLTGEVLIQVHPLKIEWETFESMNPSSLNAEGNTLESMDTLHEKGRPPAPAA